MKLAVWTSLILLSLFSLKENNTKKAINSDEQAAGFAVIELFTSEGCSSCPPADEALAQINAEFGTNVFALSFHVDYWDYLGWKDEFSNPMYSQRQQQYASVFKLESIYTPQVIVNGQKEFVGSDKTLLNKTITESLKATQNKEINIKASSDEHKNVIVNYETTADDKMVLNIAFVQLHAGCAPVGEPLVVKSRGPSARERPDVAAARTRDFERAVERRSFVGLDGTIGHAHPRRVSAKRHENRMERAGQQARAAILRRGRLNLSLVADCQPSGG